MIFIERNMNYKIFNCTFYWIDTRIFKFFGKIFKSYESLLEKLQKLFNIYNLINN